MSPENLEQLRERAQRSDPEIRAAALLHIARIEAAFDRAEARRTFEAGLEAARQIAGPNGEWLRAYARMIAAAVAPERIEEIPAGGRPRLHFPADVLVQVMVEHGHTDAAVSYVLSRPEGPDFPFAAVPLLLHGSNDDVVRRRLLYKAIGAWRSNRSEGLHGFLPVFQNYWGLLPPDEASDVAREIVEEARSHRSEPIRATYDPEGTATITSAGEHALFCILHVLRRLDPALAESLLDEFEQLAAAARRFPNGMESVREEAEARAARNRQAGGTGGGFCFGGAPGHMAYLHALIGAERDGDFEPAFAHALDRYRDDVSPADPNEAPKEFWSSTNAFRGIIFRSAKRLGRTETAAYLDRIPDADLRLFAEIELEAALGGLPELGSMTVRSPRRSRQQAQS